MDVVVLADRVDIETGFILGMIGECENHKNYAKRDN